MQKAVNKRGKRLWASFRWFYFWLVEKWREVWWLIAKLQWKTNVIEKYCTFHAITSVRAPYFPNCLLTSAWLPSQGSNHLFLCKNLFQTMIRLLTFDTFSKWVLIVQVFSKLYTAIKWGIFLCGKEDFLFVEFHLYTYFRVFRGLERSLKPTQFSGIH